MLKEDVLTLGDYLEQSKKISEILELQCPPLAVKLLRAGDDVPEGYDGSRKLRFCQALMMAKRGHKVLLNGENITCPAAASAFGFNALPEKIKSGEMLFNMGLFGSHEAASKTLGLMPRLKQGEYSAVLVISLEQADFAPDVVILEGEPEKLMWVTLADIFTEGGRHSFQTGVFQATCIDSTVVPFQTGKTNTNLGCYGCRDSTDISHSECLLGLPGNRLAPIVNNLEKLAEKAIPKFRAKGVFKLLDAEVK